MGFPAKLESREQLAGIIKAIVWLVIQHAAVNYPISAYGGFTPNMPTKLYEDPDHHKYGKYEAMLPKAPLAIVSKYIIPRRTSVVFRFSNLLFSRRPFTGVFRFDNLIGYHASRLGDSQSYSTILPQQLKNLWAL